ncbi:alpha/beta hydrolase domain-containing protein [Roseiterribacter gracilis]|uniref:Alpha/beta hydrolase domain-containing protein n=1 Tax=Roseiterribacter gracilis TaxID=2812848 RepID=A0A8S8XHZ1_9PROT|nr:hypothetical protein TMPK1_38290 [Rhodospirillales bacterium TMPK1]
MKLLQLALLLFVASAQATDLPTVRGPIPVTATSTIYGAAHVPGAAQSIDLDAAGYVEEEYFLTGTANLYGYKPDLTHETLRSAVPYTTRIVLRRPRDPAKFSGNVQLESAHPMEGNAASWAAAAPYMLRHGDAYVLLLAGADALTRGTSGDPMRRQALQLQPGADGAIAPVAAHDLLRWFDPVRYAPINWPDDDGVRWDVIVQVGQLLRSDVPQNPLHRFRVRHIYMSGWSFTGSLIRTFINEGFHDRARLANGAPVFDGYLIGVSAGPYIAGYVPLNSQTPMLPPDSPRRVLRAIDVPVIELLSENEAPTNVGPTLPEPDSVRGGHRLYEVPGQTHAEGRALGGRAGSTMQAQLAARGYPLRPPGEEARCKAPPSDVPIGHLAIAAFDNLDRWVRTGTAPPKAARMAIDPQTQLPLRDAVGNARGGVRTVHVEVPLARYDVKGDGSPDCINPRTPFLPIRRVLLPRSELESLYGNETSYRAKMEAALDRMVRARWLLPPEAAAERAALRALAHDAFAGGG